MIDFGSPAELKNACVTIGVFDGLHEGHRYLIDQCKNEAKVKGVNSVILTFDVDPDELFKADFKKLMSNSKRIRALNETGVDNVFAIKFYGIKDDEPSVFLDYIFGQNTPSSLHIGEGFKFGKKQSGDTDLLIKWGREHGMDVHVHKLVEKDGEVVSSTRLREKLK